MSHPRETADLEAQIEALIRRAGDSLRQQLDNVKHSTDQASPSPSTPENLSEHEKRDRTRVALANAAAPLAKEGH
jgi:hypothetical protein